MLDDDTNSSSFLKFEFEHVPTFFVVLILCSSAEPAYFMKIQEKGISEGMLK